MEHISLYRRFRPATFDKVIGQKHVVRTLTNQIKNDRIGHAYLFTGSRGTGKTSCAKIFARAVNCLNPIDGSPCGECEVCKALANPANIDIIEMDAASNNGVDEIRELKENAQYRPTVGRYKVYIIDEVHMLTASAFNALLKTLEEPPQHVIFILATTEVQKLPQTILSRCMRFDFRLVAKEELVGLLNRIFTELGVEADPRALQVIAAGGEGCVRDTLSLADMCLSYGGNKVTYEDALEITASTSIDALDDLAGAILEGRTADALTKAEALISSGRNTLSKDLASYFMDMLNLKNVPDAIPDGMTKEEAEVVKKRISDHSNYRISRVMDIMCGLESAMRYSSQPKVMFEAAIVRACELTTETDLDGLTNRIKELEKKLADIEKTGVKVTAVESKKDPVAPVASEPAVAPAEKKTTDINDLLSSMAEQRVEVVFNDKAEDKGDSYLAEEIWSKLVTALADADEMMLKMAASCVESGYKISGNKYVLETSDNATYNLFNRPEYREVMQKLIRRESGKEYDFVCVMANEKEQKVNARDRITLDQLFNGDVKVRPVK